MTDEASLKFYGRDASIFEIRPEVAVAPASREDLGALVRFVSEKKKAGEDVSLAARSGGTCMSGGPLTRSVAVDFSKHLNRILSVNAERAVSEPGVFFRDFEKETDRYGVMLPSYPASKSICAIGGMVSNNSGGEKTLQYGKTEKYVERLKVVLADGKEYEVGPLTKDELAVAANDGTYLGEIYRKMRTLVFDHLEEIEAARPAVSKNSAGYELWNIWDGKYFNLAKLFVGAQGTLGFVTEATFRLVPKRKHSKLTVVFLKNASTLNEITKRILFHRPESLESFDDNTLKIALKFFPDIIRAMKAKNFLKLAFKFLPEFFMVLRGGTPKLILLIELTDNDENNLAERQIRLSADLKKFGVVYRAIADKDEAEKYWTMRRESFNLLRKRIKNKQAAPFIDDFIVRPEDLSEFLPRLDRILAPYSKKLIYTVQGHVGDGNFHIIPLVDLDDPEIKRIIPELMGKVYDLVLAFRGSITAEHNDGLIRSPFLRQMFGEKITLLFEEVKAIFDPLNIMNPGKKVNSSMDYALAHIRSKS